MSLGLIVPLAVLWAIVPNDGIALIADWFFNKVKKLTQQLLMFSWNQFNESDFTEKNMLISTRLKNLHGNYHFQEP